MIGMEMIIAGSVTPRSTPQGRWGACAGVTTTRAAKSRMSVRTALVPIKLPDLRERRGEIPELALALLKQINQRRHKPRQLSKEALRRLEGHAWPGNVRELSNVLERSILYAQNDVVNPDDLLITSDHPARDLLVDLPEPLPGFSIEEYLSQVRKQLFLRALAASSGNQLRRRLGISKAAVSNFCRRTPTTQVNDP
jgi:Nif-specific regulatory protein